MEPRDGLVKCKKGAQTGLAEAAAVLYASVLCCNQLSQPPVLGGFVFFEGELIRRWITTTNEVQDFTGNQTGTLDYLLFVRDGMPMLGINSVDNVGAVLFIGPDVSQPGFINAYNGPEGGWPYETGVVVVDCKPRA